MIINKFFDRITLMYKNILAGLIFIIVAGLIAGITYAHDVTQPKLNAWFDSLTSKKGPCCSNADGSVLSDVDWETKDGKYRVRIEGNWYDVPEAAVLMQPNLSGKTMVWPVFYRSMGQMQVDIRCFIPGPMG